MKKDNFIIGFILFLLTNFSFGQPTTPTPFTAPNSKTFVEVKSKTVHPASFDFSFSGYQYVIDDSGRGKRTGGNYQARTLNLRLDKGEMLERHIYYAEYQKDVLLMGESYLEDGAGGFIIRLDGRTLKMKWKRQIPAFNVGQGLLDKNNVYLTAFGFVGKVNLDSGVYAWKHDNLYGKDSAFNSFELPEIKGNTVLFKESELYLRKEVATLQVDIRSGKIKKINR
jgi:hypothetical protein